MSDTAAHVVIIGAGHAGGSVAALLRQYGWQGPITLIGAEPKPPYQRPPLSKAWLKGQGALADLLLRPGSFYSSNHIDLRLGSEVTHIDRARRELRFDTNDVIAYDRLVLATGARARRLPVPGQSLAGVAVLRTVADADAIRPLLRPGAHIVIVGAGFIGLEVAASARLLGADVVVIEREPRVLARVASVPLSDWFTRRHAAAGVRIILDATVEAFEGRDGQVAGVQLSDGTTIPCDVALIGVGAAPNDGVARAAGLACEDGIVVDQQAATSDPTIHAIGDCTWRPLPMHDRHGRLESVANALEQAKQAAATLCGRPVPAPEVPLFWSDQYEDRLQMAGLPFDIDQTVIRGDPLARSVAIFHLSGNGTVQAVEAVNAPAEFMAGRLMIARRTQVVAARLADVACSIRELAR